MSHPKPVPLRVAKDPHEMNLRKRKLIATYPAAAVYDATGSPVSAAAGGMAKSAQPLRNIAKNATKFATWNVRTLLQTGCQTMLALSLRQHGIDVACLQELRLPDPGETELRLPQADDPSDMRVAYHLIHSGAERGQQGVGFALTPSAFRAILERELVSPRIARLRIAAKPVNITLITAYAPTNADDDAVKDEFYEQLNDVLTRVPPLDCLLASGDFNAKVGPAQPGEESHVGRFSSRANKQLRRRRMRHGDLAERSDNGVRLVSLAMFEDLVLANTFYQKKPHQLHTWKSNDAWGTRNQIDFFLIRRRWRSSITDVAAI